MSTTTLSNKIIWLTGASSGIGKALAIALAELNNKVIVSARSSDKLTELKTQYPRHIECLPIDITDKNNIASHRQKLEELSPHIDIAILNAGTCEYVDVTQFDSSLIERVMHTNFTGTVYSLDLVLPLLRNATQPYIVCVASSAAYSGLTRAEAYGASKAALAHFFESLRVDLSPEGIDVSVVFPGFVKTPLTDKNDFPMPMRISSEQAAQAIVAGMSKRSLEIHFPKLFCWFLRVFARLPKRLRHHLATRMIKS